MSSSYSITTLRALLMYLIVSLFLFFEMALQVSPSVMSFNLMKDLNIGPFALGIMSGCYFYTYTLMQIPSGRLLDKFNPRLIVPISICTCCLGSLLLSVAQSFIFACLARLLMGMGSAFAFVSVLVVTADIFKGKYFATLTGVTQMLAALGAISGQLPVTILIRSVGWRSTMLIFSAAGLALAVIIFYFLRYKKTNTMPAKKVRTSAYNKKPIRQIISNPQTWYVGIYACLLWAPMSGFASLWGVPYLIKVDDLSHGSAATLCSMMWLGLALASPVVGYVSTRLTNRKLPLVLSALCGMISFGLLLSFHFRVFSLAVLLFIAGAACSGQALSFTVIKENNLSGLRGTAIAFNNVAVVISGAIFQPIIGCLLEHINFATSMNFKLALSIIFLAYLLAFIVSKFFIVESFRGNIDC